MDVDFGKLTRRDFLKVAAGISAFFATRGIWEIAGWAEDYAYPLVSRSGVIATFEGPIGSGKTLAAVAFAYAMWEKEKRPVYSNIRLDFPYKELDIDQFDSITDSTILLDNAFLYLDNRRSQTNQNKLWSYMLSQNRKRGNMVFLATPKLDFLDKRTRCMVDERVRCRMDGDTLKLLAMDLKSGNRQKVAIEGKSFYPLYDTCELARLKGGKAV